MNISSNEIFKLINEGNSIINSDPEEAFEITEKAFNLANEKSDKSAMAYCFLNFALTYKALSNIPKWVNYGHHALDLFTELHDNEGIAVALNLLSCAYFHTGLYEDSLINYLRVLDLCDSDRYTFTHICALNNIAEIYRVTEQYSVAFRYYKKALVKAKEFNYESLASSILFNMGQVMLDKKNYDKALTLLLESYSVALELENPILQGEIENHIGLTYFKNENYKKAMEFYDKALLHLEKVNNKYYIIDLFLNIGLLKLKTNSNSALDYFNKAISYAKKIDCKTKLSQIYLKLSKYYESIGDFKNSLQYYKKYHLTEEELCSSIIKSRLEIIRIQYRYVTGSDELEHLKIINEKLEMEIESQSKRLQYMKNENKDLRFKALKDSLTKISNRHAIDQKFNTLWKYPKLNKNNMVLFMIDIDNFKLYNDSWGHIQGDKCLSIIAEGLKEICKCRHDFCGRYGGEEFIYFSENLTYKESVDLGNLISEKIKDLNIKSNDNINNEVVTVSIGGVYGNLSSLKSATNMIEIADKQLYTSKRTGKDKVTLINTLNNEFIGNSLKPMTLNL